MRILLLGASGLLGHNVLKLLVEQHHQVTCLLRRPIKFPFPTPEVLFLEGSPLVEDELQRAANKCEAIINCAGITDMSLLHQEDYFPINRDLCHHIVQLMEASEKIHSFVQVSTANTIGFGTSEMSAREESPMQEPFLSSFYALSKRAGEEYIQEAAKRLPKKHFVIINPGFMVGPYDLKPSSGKLLIAAYRLPLMAAPKGGKSFVPVTDVAAAVVAALSHGRSGCRYLVTGDNLSLRQFYQLQAQVCKYQQKVISLPNSLALIGGKIGDLLRTFGIRTQLSTRNVRQLLVREYYDDLSAQEELGIKHSSLAEAIRSFYAER